MATKSIDQTVRELADLEAIRDLARRYAHCVWQNDVPGAIDLFTDDGVMDTGDGRPPIVGRKNLLEQYGQMLTDAGLKPMVHNHVIELDGDRARGNCYLDLRAAMGGESMVGCGVYDDEYVREGDGWKFKRRTLVMDYLVPLSQGWAKK